MNLDPVERRLGRPVTDDEAAAFAAVKPVLNLLCGRDYGIGWMRDDTSAHNANWYGYAILTGARITTCFALTPELAADTLAELLLARIRCPRCGHRTCSVTPEPGHCLWRRTGPVWHGECTSAFLTQASTPTRKDSPS